MRSERKTKKRQIFRSISFLFLTIAAFLFVAGVPLTPKDARDWNVESESFLMFVWFFPGDGEELRSELMSTLREQESAESMIHLLQENDFAEFTCNEANAMRCFIREISFLIELRVVRIRINPIVEWRDDLSVGIQSTYL